MKKAIVILFLVFSVVLSAQRSEAEEFYNDFNIYFNSVKIGEVVMTYDIAKPCINNFLISNTAKYSYIIYFDMYLNNELSYKGWTKLNSGGMMKFNNAFVDCNSKNKKVKLIITQAEFY